MSEHVLYVAAAYGVTILAIGALIGWIVADQSARRREMAQFEAEGVHRRSEKRQGKRA